MGNIEVELPAGELKGADVEEAGEATEQTLAKDNNF